MILSLFPGNNLGKRTLGWGNQQTLPDFQALPYTSLYYRVGPSPGVDTFSFWSKCDSESLMISIDTIGLWGELRTGLWNTLKEKCYINTNMNYFLLSKNFGYN